MRKHLRRLIFNPRFPDWFTDVYPVVDFPGITRPNVELYRRPGGRKAPRKGPAMTCLHPLWSIVVLTLSRWSRQNAPALVQIVCPIQSIHHISRQLELSEGHRSGWNNSNCPMTYCMLGFSQAVLFFILLQLFHYSGNHWYSKRKMFDMFSSQRLFTF